ncbi:MAG TPA: CpXC domain-containing protein [Kofleriaceae bacterium]|nr:CpXC domain-containing protein [Kofleriaceae bacterium]
MSITNTHELTCTCGETLHATVVESLNAVNHPELRQEVMDRTLHVFPCGYCGARTMVEHRFLYFDFERRQILGVYLRDDLARARECAEHVMEVYCQRLRDDAPEAVRDLAKDFLVRVVFGYEELREKLVADDAGLSDLVVEALKCELIAGDERIRAANVVTLRLDEVTAAGDLAFIGDWMVPPTVPLEVTVPRAAYEEVAAGRATLLERIPGLASGPHVSLLRLALPPS